MSEKITHDLITRDRKHVWHPYTQHQTERTPVAIARAKGAFLYDMEGREILDLISSWWTTTHGHSHPKINKALADQAATLEHVMFAGFTHKPAVDLAQKMGERLGNGLCRTFYSDNGSTANEVALKMAYQYWRNKGKPERKLFLSFDGDYHGDTLGAMAVSKGSGFFNLFADLLCEAKTIPFAPTFEGDEDVEHKEQAALLAFEQLLETHGDDVAAIIVEPLMQGAIGMRFCRPGFLRSVMSMARTHDILVIFDEVATGFGRTGTMFAFEQCGLAPDIICLSKGLTAGYMPLSMTVTRQDLFEVFAGESFKQALAHGHSYAANPLACAVALASLQLFESENTFERIMSLNQLHKNLLPELLVHPLIEKPRVLGTVLAFDLKQGKAGYKSTQSIFLRDWYLANGLNIRPYGKTVYLMPPYCVTNEQMHRAYRGMLEGLSRMRED